MRRLLLIAIVAAVLLVPMPAFAHGLGGRSDLPVPLEFFIVGAFVVLAVSFGALAVLWPEPRLQQGPRWRGRGWEAPGWLTATLAGAGVAALLLATVAGLFGGVFDRTNIAPITVWVVFWLVVPFAAAALGNVWSAVNPWAAIGRVLRLESDTRATSVLPATFAFVAFTWLELVYDRSADPWTLGVAAVVYSAYLLAWSARVGIDAAMTTADGFTVYHRLLSSIAPFGRDPDGRIRRRGWLRALPVLPAWKGLPIFVVAMIGTVTYDGMSATVWWNRFTFDLVGTAWSATWFRTLSLLAVVAVVYGAYLAACAWAARIAGGGMTAHKVAVSFAHTLVPIALAYAFAHYFTLVAFEGQALYAAISDPIGLGWDLFGTADFRPNFTWIAPTVVWWIQLGAIVGGHVAGVVLAHDRSLAVFDPDRAVRSQYAMLALMVGLTALGLTILSAG